MEEHQPDKFRPMDYRLMSFAVAIAQLVVLAPTWMTVSDGGDLDVYSGLGWFTSEGTESPMTFLRLLSLVVYIGLVLVALVSSRTTAAVLVCAPLGLGVTIVMLFLKPDPSGSDAHWTGAPIIALLLWMVAIVVAEHGWSESGRVRPD
ncbi:hypothetical protein OG474_37595 [Kribbella sp. NBC_01505]|uniref:hypothetical protein n=1 Tax=Kribbella sp. NBC_01505 TaxID=2903580 RepID=UPI00386C292A